MCLDVNLCYSLTQIEQKSHKIYVTYRKYRPEEGERTKKLCQWMGLGMKLKMAVFFGEITWNSRNLSTKLCAMNEYAQFSNTFIFSFRRVLVNEFLFGRFSEQQSIFWLEIILYISNLHTERILHPIIRTNFFFSFVVVNCLQLNQHINIKCKMENEFEWIDKRKTYYFHIVLFQELLVEGCALFAADNYLWLKAL